MALSTSVLVAKDLDIWFGLHLPHRSPAHLFPNMHGQVTMDAIFGPEEPFSARGEVVDSGNLSSSQIRSTSGCLFEAEYQYHISSNTSRAYRRLAQEEDGH